jgi:hypothetical protein
MTAAFAAILLYCALVAASLLPTASGQETCEHAARDVSQEYALLQRAASREAQQGSKAQQGMIPEDHKDDEEEGTHEASSRHEGRHSARERESHGEHDSRGDEDDADDASEDSNDEAEATPCPDDVEGGRPPLRFELQLPYELKELNRGRFGPAYKLLKALHHALCESVGIDEARVVMLDIRGEHMRLNLLGVNSGLIQRFFDNMEGQQADDSTGSASGVKSEGGALLQIVSSDSDTDDTIIDFEVKDGSPSAMDAFHAWQEQLRDVSSKLRQGPYGDLLEKALIKESLESEEQQFDCDAGLPRWETGWSAAKKKYCCMAQLKGCAEERFDCKAGYERRSTGWSLEKAEYCCSRHDVGCKAAERSGHGEAGSEGDAEEEGKGEEKEKRSHHDRHHHAKGSSQRSAVFHHFGRALAVFVALAGQRHTMQ